MRDISLTITVKDYELMREVIDYLNNEFISLDSF
jgi:hypothetical protein